MGTVLKILVIALALVGLCVVLTTYLPAAWHNGWELPFLKLHISYAVTGILAFLTIGLVKFKFA